MIEEDIKFCLGLIGKPWVSGASGPDSFDCWGLLRYVLKERRGYDLPTYTGVKESGLAAMVRNAAVEASEHWQEIQSPEHFCAVGISRNRRVEHAGLWLNEGGGGILHCFESFGVIFQSPATIRNTGFQNFIFYKLRSCPKFS